MSSSSDLMLNRMGNTMASHMPTANRVPNRCPTFWNLSVPLLPNSDPHLASLLQWQHIGVLYRAWCKSYPNSLRSDLHLFFVIWPSLRFHQIYYFAAFSWSYVFHEIIRICYEQIELKCRSSVEIYNCWLFLGWMEAMDGWQLCQNFSSSKRKGENYRWK